MLLYIINLGAGTLRMNSFTNLQRQSVTNKKFTLSNRRHCCCWIIDFFVSWISFSALVPKSNNYRPESIVSSHITTVDIKITFMLQKHRWTCEVITFKVLVFCNWLFGAFWRIISPKMLLQPMVYGLVFYCLN